MVVIVGVMMSLVVLGFGNLSLSVIIVGEFFVHDVFT